MALMDRWGTRVTLTDRLGPRVWQRWIDKERVVAPTDRPEAETWHCWVSMEHAWSTNGQTGSTSVALMDRQGTHVTPTDTRRAHT